MKLLDGFPRGRSLAPVLLVLSLWPFSGCAAQSPSGASEITGAFEQALADCSRQTGYFPEQTDSLGPYELGPNEREWATCAYAGIEVHVLPISPVPDQYRRLIARHRELTDAVEAKRTTRTQRRQEIVAMLDAIRDVEGAALAKQRTALDQMKDVQEQERRMREIDRVQRSAIEAQRTMRVRIR